jgi:hypothetical protein
MSPSEKLWFVIGLGGAFGAAVGSMVGDAANGMALGFVGGIGLATMVLAPRNPDSA